MLKNDEFRKLSTGINVLLKFEQNIKKIIDPLTKKESTHRSIIAQLYSRNYALNKKKTSVIACEMYYDSSTVVFSQNKTTANCPEKSQMREKVRAISEAF